MADLSLDDFIKKRNVKGRIGNQPGPGKMQAQQKKFVPNKIGAAQQQVKNFDARQRLGPKTVLDARDKIIINKKSGVGDARNKIVQKQVQKGTFDARSVLQRQMKKGKRQKSGGPSVNPGQQTTGANSAGFQLTRTLTNQNAKGRAQVMVTNSGLRVTRPVPSAQVALYGSSIQVSKRVQPYNGGDTQPISSAVPIIQIQNDRYRGPMDQPYSRPNQQAHYISPPPPTKYYEPSYSYSEPSFSNQRSYKDLDDPQYNPASIAPEFPKIQISNTRPIEVIGGRSGSYSTEYAPTRVPPGAASVSQGVRQAVPKPVLQPAKLTQAGVKRRQPQPEPSGPLRLGKGGGPGIDLGSTNTSPSKKLKMTAPVTVSGGDLGEQDDSAEVISPLQGFRVMVTNLFNGVTQDDIIELFGAVGPLKKAKLLKPGTAEVVYVSKNDAVSAVQKYHSRELDGQPMYVKMTTPEAATVKKALGDHDAEITGEALKLYKKGTGIGPLIEAPIEIPTIHRALFKAGPPGPNKSVKFTVKI